MSALALALIFCQWQPAAHVGCGAVAGAAGYGLARACKASKPAALVASVGAGVVAGTLKELHDYGRGSPFNPVDVAATATGATLAAVTAWKPNVGLSAWLVVAPAVVVGCWSDARSPGQLIAQTALGSLLLTPFAMEMDRAHRKQYERQAVITFAVGIAACGVDMATRRQP